MTGFGLRKNIVFEWSSSKFRIDRTHENGDVVLERIDDGAISVIQRQVLLTAYRKGELAAIAERETSTTSTIKVFSRPLDELSNEVQNEVARRRHYLHAIYNAGNMVFTKAHLEPLIRIAADEINDPKPPSATSIYRWYVRYRNARDDRALIPRIDRRGARVVKQCETILRLASDSISEAFKVSPMASGPSIYARLLSKIENENRYLLPIEHIKPPSLRTVYRMLLRVDAYGRTTLKEGKIAADKRFLMVRAGVQSTQILERVEIDHTPLDLFLIDEKSRLPLGRPTLTVVIDHYSRMLLGFHLSFGNPSTAAVMGALRHAILPKETTSAQEHPELNPTHEWPCYGRPDVMVVDNGMEFHGKDLESVAYDLGIRIQFCPKHQPRFKGVVERYLGTCNRFFAHQLPGTSLSRWHLRGDYDPLRHAVLTLSDFQMIFHKWVLDVYAQTVHRGTGETPWARWHAGLQRREPELPESVHALKQRIGQIEERTLRADGIQLHGIRYNGANLAPILQSFGPGTKVRVLFDSEDLGDIQVWGPDSPEPVVVPALDQNHARGLTSLQNDLIRATVREKGASQQDQTAIAAARQSIISTVEGLMGSRKQRDRRRAAEILGGSTSKTATETSRPLFSATSSGDEGASHQVAFPPSTKFGQIDAPPPAYAFFRSKRQSNGDATK